MHACDLMATTPAVVTPTSDLERAAELLNDGHVGLVPVVDDLRSMHLVGVIADRHVMTRCHAKHHSSHCTVAHHLSTDASFVVHKDDTAEDVLELMDQSRMRRLPVVDEQQRVIGVIAQADVIRSVQASVRKAPPRATTAQNSEMAPAFL